MENANQQLVEKIERLVQEHIALTRRMAMDAVERAFTSSVPSAPSTSAAKRKRAKGRHRDPSEVAALSEQVYSAVCAHPGESMMVIMTDIGKSARELHRPMQMLKRAGRVRSVGERQRTRYFPALAGASGQE